IASSMDMSCHYSTSCSGSDTCIASISGSTNAHAGGCGEYSTKICCSGNTYTYPVGITYTHAISMNGTAGEWVWSNFTWSNSSVDQGTTVGWRIHYNDSAGNENVTNIQAFTVKDTTSPSIDYVSPTEENNTYPNRNWIFANTTASDLIAMSNVTFRLYNSTGLINATANTSLVYQLNWTDLADGVYWFNATAYDLTSNSNTTETRWVTVDTTYPTIDFSSGTESSGVHRARDWVYVNVSVTETNPANITFYLYNSTQDLVNSTYFNNANWTTYFNFTDLADADEIYYYNATIYDNSSWSNSTSTRTITLDATQPTIDYVSPTEANMTHFNRTWIAVNVSATETNPANITFRLYNSTWSLVNSTFYDSANITYFVNFTAITDYDENYYYNVTIYDNVSYTNTTGLRKITLDATTPTIDYASPTEESGTHRNRDWVYVNVSVTEVNPANITFRLYNSTQDLVNSTYFNSANLSYSLNFTDISDTNELYYYNVSIYDNSSWSNSTSTRNITLDSTTPAIDFASPTEESGVFRNRTWVYVNISVVDTNF
ncbi:MAG: hypothetical protein GW914_02715, partial [Candidatus Aenigmarchaeota archaeon]|nr:hypothetical protein [Candidatus Aenigmarchaeota archaeon]